MFIREHTNPVYYPRCKFVYRYYLGQIRKTKIYGHWFHRNKNFYILENHNNILHNKKRLVWCNVKPSHYDKDVNFLIEIAIMDRQKKLKDEISKLETWINIVSCKGDEYTIAGEWESKDGQTKRIRRTAKLVRNGEGDELYYQKGDEPMRKYLIRPGVSEAVAIAAQEGLLIYNEREKA